jgi:glycosyltransferase involved in cell wall biosynthesis
MKTPTSVVRCKRAGIIDSIMKVSVLINTYNHQPYIAQAIEGALMQRVNFPVEIVVGEDKSTDGTGEVVEQYARKYPQLIRNLPRPQNLGMHENFYQTYAQCTGQYIALLEGDDYWTDPMKLHIQAAALDANPQWAICFHPAGILEDGRFTPSHELPVPAARKPVYEFQDILRENMIQTATTMFRNHLIPEFPAWIKELEMVDWPLHILNARRGQIGFINRTMAVYRHHAGGVWSMMTMKKKFIAMRKLYALLAEHVAPEYRDMLEARAALMVVEEERLTKPG